MKNRRQLARTAHDVRHLCICEGCAELGDDRDMVHSLENCSPFAFHPKCFHKRYGDEAVLKFLSKTDQDKFALSDIPTALMKQLVG